MSLDAYKKASHTADIVVLSYETVETNDIKKSDIQRLKVLLIKRKDEPFKDMWSLPGGFVDYDKTLEEAARNKLKLKTGMDDVYIEQLYTYGDNLHRDPRGRVISTAYIALVNMNKISNLAPDTAWFTISTLRSKSGKVTDIKIFDENIAEVELAFDHSKILLDALERLRGKIMYTDIVLNMLPETFTIREAQNVYELIYGKAIPTFRRLISSKIEPTGVKVGGFGYRPSELYKRSNTEE